MQQILDLLNSDLGKTIVSGISRDSKVDSNTTASVLSMALPVLTKAMQRNASNQKGAEQLANVLENRHNGSILDNLDSFFGGGVDDTAKHDGTKILGHILGNKQSGVENVIGQKMNIDASSVGNILKIAAPILMGYLGRNKKQTNVNSSGDLGDMLGGMLGGSSTRSEQGLLEKILDADGDGSVIDDIAGMLLNNNRGSSNGGLGSILGGFFGK